MKRRRINWIASDVIRKVRRRYLEWSARLTGKRFYCRALGGESDYNLTINCDLTVSCTCQDYDGSGHLGDLNKNSFPEVFYGPVARRFREDLAKGKLPIMTCARCGDLLKVPKAQSRAVTGLPRGTIGQSKVGAAPHHERQPDGAPPHPYPLPLGGGEGVQGAGDGAQGANARTAGLGGSHTRPTANAAEMDLDQQIFAGPRPRLPYRGLLLENTVRCNIDCIGCDRQSAARIRTTLQMDLDKLSRMADLVSELGLEQLFYLNLGEPFLSPNIGAELSVLRQKNPKCRIVISTNSIVLNTDAKREAALNASHIYFSIAGVNEGMLKKYEHHGNFQKAYDNMKALVAYRNARNLAEPVLEWKYLLFNWNDRASTITQALELAKAAGVDVISFWPTHNPFYGYSFRYALGGFNGIGVKSWKGREVDLRPAARAVVR